MRARVLVAIVVAAIGFTASNAWTVFRAYSVAQKYAHVMLPYSDYWAGVGRAGVTEAWHAAISREIVILTVAIVMAVLVGRGNRATTA